MERIQNAHIYMKREIPMIAGSSAAFVAIIVILILIIVVSCAAAVYIVREDKSRDRHDERALHRQSRARYATSRRSAIFSSPRDWFRGSRQRPAAGQTDKSRNMLEVPRQGWMPAGNSSDWDLESSTGKGFGHYNSNDSTLSTPIQLADHQAMSAPISSNHTSLAPSSAHFDSQTEQGYSYSGKPRHSVVPSIHSQLYSPESPTHDPTNGAILASSESLERLSDHDHTRNISDPFSEPSSQSIRSSGSKFVEGL